MKSMTGYGAASGQSGLVRLSVEIRSVNQRFLDLKINAPREYGRFEGEWRRLVADSVGRGRVEVYVSRSAAHRTATIELQEEVAGAYLKALKKLQKAFDLPGPVGLDAFLHRADVFQSVERAADIATEVAEVGRLLAKALEAHTRERVREGLHLKRDMKARCARLLAISKSLQKSTAGQGKRLHERLQRRLAELLGNQTLDPARLAQETAFLADRADVTEEIVRLKSHLEALAALLDAGDAVAKRIDFMLQEVNRELNTIGSKAADLGITNLVLDGKTEVEKLREQVQNVE